MPIQSKLTMYAQGCQSRRWVVSLRACNTCSRSNCQTKTFFCNTNLVPTLVLRTLLKHPEITRTKNKIINKLQVPVCFFAPLTIPVLSKATVLVAQYVPVVLNFSIFERAVSLPTSLHSAVSCNILQLCRFHSPSSSMKSFYFKNEFRGVWVAQSG